MRMPAVRGVGGAAGYRLLFALTLGWCAFALWGAPPSGNGRPKGHGRRPVRALREAVLDMYGALGRPMFGIPPPTS